MVLLTNLQANLGNRDEVVSLRAELRMVQINEVTAREEVGVNRGVISSLLIDNMRLGTTLKNNETVIEMLKAEVNVWREKALMIPGKDSAIAKLHNDVAGRDAEIAGLTARISGLEGVLATKSAECLERANLAQASVDALKVERKRKKPSEYDVHPDVIANEKQRAEAAGMLSERDKKYDADEELMLARHGYALAGYLSHGRWKCGCGGRGGSRAFVEGCRDPYNVEKCSLIQCKCFKFTCLKSDTERLEAHFNKICTWYKHGDLYYAGTTRYVKASEFKK